MTTAQPNQRLERSGANPSVDIVASSAGRSAAMRYPYKEGGRTR